MKKSIVVILAVVFMLAGCGKQKEEGRLETEVVEPAFTATSYVTSSTEESVQVETQEVILPAEATQEETNVVQQEEIVADTDYDFSACEDAPVLSGEARKLDWSMVFDENCVVIGEDKYPAYMKISDFGSNITLKVVNIGKESPDNPKEICDYYTLCYHGYKACGIITS